jgi:ribosomal-protein-alanine N-acetyltransferase
MAPSLESSRLVYIPVCLKHLSERYLSWMNDSEVTRYLESGGNYNEKMLRNFIEAAIEKKIFFWAIHIKSNNKHIGNIKIDPINKRHGLGEYGILLGDKSEWGKGYAREASETIINFCFNDLNLRKMTLGVVEINIAAVKLYQSLGFSTEGTYKEHGLYDGKYRNMLRMALFNSGYYE